MSMNVVITKDGRQVVCETPAANVTVSLTYAASGKRCNVVDANGQVVGTVCSSFNRPGPGDVVEPAKKCGCSKKEANHG